MNASSDRSEAIKTVRQSQCGRACSVSRRSQPDTFRDDSSMGENRVRGKESGGGVVGSGRPREGMVGGGGGEREGCSRQRCVKPR